MDTSILPGGGVPVQLVPTWQQMALPGPSMHEVLTMATPMHEVLAVATPGPGIHEVGSSSSGHGSSAAISVAINDLQPGTHTPTPTPNPNPNLRGQVPQLQRTHSPSASLSDLQQPGSRPPSGLGSWGCRLLAPVCVPGPQHPPHHPRHAMATATATATAGGGWGPPSVPAWGVWQGVVGEEVEDGGTQLWWGW